MHSKLVNPETTGGNAPESASQASACQIVLGLGGVGALGFASLWLYRTHYSGEGIFLVSVLRSLLSEISEMNLNPNWTLQGGI